MSHTYVMPDVNYDILSTLYPVSKQVQVFCIVEMMKIEINGEAFAHFLQYLCVRVRVLL